MTPASEHLRSEPHIVAGLAAASLGPSTPIDWLGCASDLDRVRDLIEASVPGFHDYNHRVRLDGGFALPNPAREGDFSGLPDGRAVLTTYPLPGDGSDAAARGVAHAPDGSLTLMTIRSHDQFNTTVYGEDDRYRGVHGDRRVVFVSPADAARLGLGDGQRVDVTSHAPDGVERAVRGFRVVLHDLPSGDCAAYFPEANPLVPLSSVAIGSNTPTSKAVPVTLAAAAG
jgi:anaerobic selenocysteine-containing dehydrogenase